MCKGAVSIVVKGSQFLTSYVVNGVKEHKLSLHLYRLMSILETDPDFNPFVDLQAQAQAHRIGQEKVVHVYPARYQVLC